MSMGDRHIEMLEVLAGARSRGARGKSAVRLERLRPLLELPVASLQQVSSAPTAAEYNALLAQLLAVSAALNAIGQTLRDDLK